MEPGVRRSSDLGARKRSPLGHAPRSGGALLVRARATLPGGLELVHVGGHFDGSQVLFWPAGAGGKGVLLTADMPNVCSDPRWVTFMRSYPNYIPLSGAEAERVVTALRPLAFDRVYGWTPERVIRTDARRSLERSLARHGQALRGEHDVVTW